MRAQYHNLGRIGWTNCVRVRASALMEAVYTFCEQERSCGVCKSCVRQNSRQRKLTYVWCVAGDILLELKRRNAAKAAAKAKGGPLGARAPFGADHHLMVMRLRRRREERLEEAREEARDAADEGGLFAEQHEP